jgi:hypothetical protein
MMHAKPERPVPFQGDLRNLPEALAPLKEPPNWVCWRYEWRNDKKGIGKWAKPPFQPKNPQQYAKNNDPSTWGTYKQALAAFEAGQCDGIGFNLLGTDFAAFDIDNCRDPATGDIAPEAMAIVDRATSYTEVTVSGTGLRIIGHGSGSKIHRKQQIPQSAVGVESYRGAERYIVITGNPLADTRPSLSDIDGQIDAVVAQLDGEDIAEQGDDLDRKTRALNVLPEKLTRLIDHGVLPNEDLSAAFHHVVCWLGDRGWSATQIEARIASKPIVPERFANRLSQEIARSVSKAKSNNDAAPRDVDKQQAEPQALSYDDFYALMTEHKYIFAPSGEVWPMASVNARLGPKASSWLDQNRPVEQITWAPGASAVITDRLIANGGWIERPGSSVYNLYRAPMVKSVAGSADPWLDHITRLYGEDTDHIVKWLAQRVQRPHEKINHALVLGGKQGIGKDTILEPVKHAVGPWNVNEVSPQQLLGRFNGFLKSVILRVSEARDLGEFDRFAFYDHTKVVIAAPPDVLRIDEKNRQEYAVPNICGVIITTNHKSDGIYLPSDDRRHYVAWSDIDKSAFDCNYFPNLYRWYEDGGYEIVAHYLQNLDLTDFNPKAPPPQTEAFFEIVNASRTPEDADMADALEALGWPDVVTIYDASMASTQADFAEYLKKRENSRRIPHRFEACGYTPVRNPDAKDGLWKLRHRRQVIYARNTLGKEERLTVARNLLRG